MRKLIGFIATLIILAIGIWIVLAILSASQGPIPMADTAETTLTTQDAPQIPHLTYTLIPADSTLTWMARRLVGAQHTGTVDIQSGALTFTDTDTSRIFESGVFIVNMNTIAESNDNQIFLKHIRGKDFFDVETYPTAILDVQSVTWTGRQNVYNIAGALTILDTTANVTFPATILFTDDGATATAAFDIDRAVWGIVYDSVSVISDIGDRAIDDRIGFLLELTFVNGV
ncbi:MAG: YceI family protein [Patescibacteria group bacterium]